MSSRLALCPFLALACLTFCSDRAWAQSSRQERLFVVVPGVAFVPQIFEVDTSAETFGRILNSTPLSGTFTVQHAWHPVSGGRFLVGTDGYGLDVFDTRLLVGREFPVTGDLLAVDTHRPRVFLSAPPLGFSPLINEVNIVDLGTGVVSSLPTAPYPYYKPPAAYAGLVDRLFLQDSADPSIVNAVDVATGAVVQSIDIDIGSSDPVRAMVTDTAGSRLFVLTVPYSYVSTPAQLTAFDVATSAQIKRVNLGDLFRDPSFGSFPFQALRLDEERGRLLVGTLVVLDATTFELLGATGGVAGDAKPVFAFTGPRSPFVIFSSQEIGGRYAGEPSRCVVAQLERRNAATGALEAIADIGASTTLTTSRRRFVGCSTHLMMATVPRAPQNFVGAVNGRQVTLLWTDPGNTTHFDIEVGSAAGLSNIMTRSVSGTTFTVNGVPSGRYYVRLRAINNIGRSVPTADVEIIVP
jgi:hypothetical protein